MEEADRDSFYHLVSLFVLPCRIDPALVLAELLHMSVQCPCLDLRGKTNMNGKKGMCLDVLVQDERMGRQE